jgi:hypothetical protein
MVRCGYNQFEEQYGLIKESACGRQACSVLIFVALEVIYSLKTFYFLFIDDLLFETISG